MKPKNPHLIASVALAGLAHAELRPRDRADLFEGLGSLLAPPISEAARYAATCIRECERAELEFIAAVGLGKKEPVI